MNVRDPNFRKILLAAAVLTTLIIAGMLASCTKCTGGLGVCVGNYGNGLSSFQDWDTAKWDASVWSP